MKPLASIFVTLMLYACSNDAGIVKPLRVAVLPDQAPAALKDAYLPLIDYLEAATALDLELIIPASYTQMLEEFDTGSVHVALFGGLTFTQAEARSDAEPLVMRDVDLAFTSCYLVSTRDPRQSIEEFAGETIAFGPRLSTSGHLMPRYFLAEKGIVVDDVFASVRHSSGHDQTAMWVADNSVTIGAVNCVILQSMLGSGRISSGAVRVIDTTPAYVNYVWAVQPDIGDDLKTRLRNAFLALDATKSEHRDILTAVGAGGYLPAGREDFDAVRSAVDAVGLLSDADET